MSSAIEIIGCQNCGQKLRVKSEHKTRAICPICQKPPQMTEMVTLNFLCTSTDKSFSVLFRKIDGEENFEIFNIIPHEGSIENAGHATGGVVTEEKEYDLDFFDCAGWYCPFCDWAKEISVETLFVKCGKCERLVCGSRVYRQGENKIFRCSESCGRESEIGTESISSYTAASTILSMNYGKDGELPGKSEGDALPGNESESFLLNE